MLAALRRIRELQLAQRDALVAGDLELLDALTDERDALQATLVPLERSGLGPADTAEARAIATLVAEDQAELIRIATDAREGLGREIRGIGTGRAAVSGYRPASVNHAVLFDSSR